VTDPHLSFPLSLRIEVSRSSLLQSPLHLQLMVQNQRLHSLQPSFQKPPLADARLARPRATRLMEERIVAV
jgi:hypothetical protein